MKEIQLVTKGKVALVDDEDFEYLNQFRWYYAGKYVVRVEGPYNKRSTIYMHREVMKTPVGVFTDHINRDRFDNRKSNLRFCTYGENLRNKVKKPNCKHSIYKGVAKLKHCKRYYAHIQHQGKYIHLGYHDTQEQAALAYDMAAKYYFKEFALLNFPENIESTYVQKLKLA